MKYFKKKVRIGLVGYQWAGTMHSRAYRELASYEDAAMGPVMQTLVGRNEEHAKLAAVRLGWMSYETNWRRLLIRDDIDIIDIASPTASHAEIAIAALEAGKHVISAHPLALHSADAARMLAAARKSQCIHMAANHLLYVPAIRVMKQWVEERTIGELRSLQIHYSDDSLLGQAVGIGRYLAGEFGRVTAAALSEYGKEGSWQAGVSEERARAADTASNRLTASAAEQQPQAFLASLEGGVAGIFCYAPYSCGGRRGIRIELGGTQGMIRWSMDNMNQLKLYAPEQSHGKRGSRSIRCTAEEHPQASYCWPLGQTIGTEHTFYSMIGAFLQSILTGKELTPSFEDGYRNLLVREAVYTSAAEDRPVDILYSK
ncbi:dehydrogenase [Paenibacillus sp. 598K]|uniref:Gfo/Idh/MocA family oxidoreductase n=1 Tax=Paenibacillus sp. 598K TaxID=1117987 RepID=UPI000FFA642F|nr:Gfo/Idh/MocA family oxidoreductase [Paenibacillus sp. 598K]GBF71802.1 dehydrogenase [Paenibacillus sp. 598K]